MNGIACFAITWRLCWSFWRKTFPRFNIIVLTSFIVLSSSFGDAKVMKQMKSSLAEHTDVMGFPLFFNVFTANLIVLTSSWIVVTAKKNKKCEVSLRWVNLYINYETHNLSSQAPTEAFWLRLCHRTYRYRCRQSLKMLLQSELHAF